MKRRQNSNQKAIEGENGKMDQNYIYINKLYRTAFYYKNNYIKYYLP